MASGLQPELRLAFSLPATPFHCELLFKRGVNAQPGVGGCGDQEVVTSAPAGGGAGREVLRL